MASPNTLGTGAPAAGTPEPGAGGTPAAGAPNTPTGAVNPGTGAPAAGSGAPAEKSYSFKEDRTDWIPPHRLSETARARQAAEQKAQELEQALEVERKRVRAALGVDPKDPKAEEATEMREALKGILTELGLDLDALKGLNKQQVQALLQGSEHATAAANTLYDRHRDEMFDKVEGEIRGKLRLDKLTPRQIEQVRSAYAQRCAESYQTRERLIQQGRENEIDDNDFIGRHLKSDPALVTEFVADFLGDWYEPARRTVSQGVVRRQGRPVPSGGRSGEPVVTKVPEIDFNDANAFGKALVEARKAGG